MKDGQVLAAKHPDAGTILCPRHIAQVSCLAVADQRRLPGPLRQEADRAERLSEGELLSPMVMQPREAQLREMPIQGVRPPFSDA